MEYCTFGLFVTFYIFIKNTKKKNDLSTSNLQISLFCLYSANAFAENGGSHGYGSESGT